MGAPSRRRWAAHLGALSTGVVAVLAAIFLLVASSAFADEIPHFRTETLKLDVGSTWVAVDELVGGTELLTTWSAEYAPAEADGKAPPMGSSAWTVVSGGEFGGSIGEVNASIVYIGEHNTTIPGGEAAPRLNHLKAETSYVIRFLAKNADGEALNEKDEHGETIFFTTLPVKRPSLSAFRVFVETQLEFFDEGLTDTTAGFKARIETDGAATGYDFEYSLPENGHAPAEHSASWKAFTSGASGSISVAEDYAIVEAHVAGLAPEATYYVRVRASNEKGETVQTKYKLRNPAMPREEVESFTTRTAKPEATPPLRFRNVTRGSAVIGDVGVSPHGSETVWRLEYATSMLGPWEDVPGAVGTISQAQAEATPYGGVFNFSARLNGLLPAKIYYVRMFAENSAGEGVNSAGEPVSIETQGISHFETVGPPTATAFAVHALHGESQRLLGAVNPKNTPTSAEQTITIEGVPTGGSFTLTFMGQTTAPIAFNAPAEGPGSVESALANLPGDPEAIVEGNAGGPYVVSFAGKDREVSEPQIQADGSRLTPSGTVTVLTNQQGGEANEARYRFEYLSQKQFEAEGGFAKATSTSEVDVGSGNSEEFVGHDLPSGLTPGETYRYLMVVSSTAAGIAPVESPEQALTVPAPAPTGEAAACPNEAFRTGLSTHLPDCRAYEQLTPVDKEGAQEPFGFRLQTAGGVIVGEDGQHAALETYVTDWGSGPGVGGSPYFFSREEGKAWRLLAGSPQPETGVKIDKPQLYNGDLTQIAFESEYHTSEGQGKESENIEYEVGPGGGPYTTVASVPRSNIRNETGSGWVASSADFSKLVLQSEDRTLLGGESTGTKSGFDLYEYTAQQGLRQVNVDSEGDPLGTCGATISRGLEEGDVSHTQSSSHSLSADGSSVFFEAVPGKTCSEAKNLYVRVNGTETVDVGTYSFLAANKQGTRLLLEKQSGELHEVVLYETESKAVTPLFTLHSSISDADELHVSGELSTLYFVSGEQLTPEAPASSEDFYRYDIPVDGAPAGTLHFLFTAAGGERGEGSRLSVTPSGRYLYFMSREVSGLPGGGNHLTGFGTGTETGQVYRYDDAENVVECASCASSFDPEPKEGATLYGIEGQPFINGGVSDYTQIAADGDFAFFTTPAALVPQDVDGEIPPEDDDCNGKSISSGCTGEYIQIDAATSPSSDIYEWRKDGIDGCTQLQGCLALITDGRGGILNLLLGSAEDGRDVLIYTRSKLLPQDNDTSGDIYDARIDGGFAPLPPRPTECEGDACSSPLGAPNDATPSSLAFSGAGNAILAPAGKPVSKSGKPKKKPKRAVKKKGKSGKGKKAGKKKARKSNERRGK